METNVSDVLLECGIGYGKTFVGALFITHSVQKYPDRNFMIVSRDIPQFKKAVYPELMKAFDIWNYQEGVDYTYNKTDQIITFHQYKVTIFIVGALNYDSAFRGPNIAIIWADEADFYSQKAWETMLGRLRIEPELLRCTSSPKGFNHIHEYFYTNKDKTTLVLKAPTWENNALSDRYIKNLKKTYSPRLFQQEVGAKRLRINVGMVYNEFDRKIHVKECKHLLNDYDQLYFFTDYNISNYCGIYMFNDGKITYAIGEEHLKFEGSRVMAQKIKAKFPKRPIIVVGDSTGNNKRDVAIDYTNYQHFENAGLFTKNFLNPPVQSRIISTNSNLYHQRLIIDPSCKTLIKDLELMSWKEDGSGVDKSNIDLSHASDAYTYGCWFFKPLSGSSKSEITMIPR